MGAIQAVYRPYGFDLNPRAPLADSTTSLNSRPDHPDQARCEAAVR
jgi:hypothetical protein